MQHIKNDDQIELATNVKYYEIDASSSVSEAVDVATVTPESSKPITIISKIGMFIKQYREIIFTILSTLFVGLILLSISITLENNYNKAFKSYNKDICTVVNNCITKCDTFKCTDDDSFDCYNNEYMVQPNGLNSINCTVKSNNYDSHKDAFNNLYNHNINNTYRCQYKYNFITNGCDAMWDTYDAKDVIIGKIVKVLLVGLNIMCGDCMLYIQFK